MRADKAFQPLRRALLNDRAKIHALTQNASEQNLTDPAIATAVRNLQKSNALQDISALHPDNLPHLLSFNWCFDPVYSGTSKKADAIHIAMFLKSSTYRGDQNSSQHRGLTRNRGNDEVDIQDNRHGKRGHRLPILRPATDPHDGQDTQGCRRPLSPPLAHRLPDAPDQQAVHGVVQTIQIRKVPQHPH